MASALFKACIQALGKSCVILSEYESNKIIEQFEREIPIIKGGSRIDWDYVPIKFKIEYLEDLLLELKRIVPGSIDMQVYIFWNNAKLPVITTDLLTILDHFDDVISVGFETWMYNPNQGYIIEYYYRGEMNIGLVPQNTECLSK